MTCDAVAERIRGLQEVVENAMAEAERCDLAASRAMSPRTKLEFEEEADMHLQRVMVAEGRLEQIYAAM